MNEENTTSMPPEGQAEQNDRDARAEELESTFSYPFASFPIAILVFVCGYIVTCIVKKIPFVGKWII